MTNRPDPDELLKLVTQEENLANRGSLRIFFGYAAGVGKTYAMLQAAQQAKRAGRDVAVGYVEPHGRRETEAMLEGLEVIPFLKREYRGVTLKEFDLDSALARTPEIMLVDELAHTNAEGMRHTKRWQDVEELQEAGIHVWTTLNVQHIESLNDIIGQVTGVTVRETVPDRIFDEAEELELADIAPEELLERLQAGKVYLPEQAKRAITGFFQKANLSALREMSLRQAAQRIHSELELARRNRSIEKPWATADRVLVCVGKSPTTSRVIRTAKRLATALDSPWIAASVEINEQPGSKTDRIQLADHFRLAERLGAETVTLTGHSFSSSLLDYARSRNVTKIVIGKTQQRHWRRLIYGSVVDEILEKSGEIDVYVIHGASESTKVADAPKDSPSGSWLPYAFAFFTVAVSAGIAAALAKLQLADAEANTVMLFLASVVMAAYRFGRGPAMAASVFAVVVFDFFFVQPYFTFAIADAQYIVTFAVMLVIGIVVGTLASSLKAQVERARIREQRTSTLYLLGKQLSSLSGTMFIVAAAGKRIAELVDGEVAVFLNRENATPDLVYGSETAIAKHSVSGPAAQWAIDHDQIAGVGTDTLPNANALFIPLTASQQTLGALAIRTADSERLREPDQQAMLEACASQLALAVERDQLGLQAAEARIATESEQMRNSLLSGVSHDLKTPLAAIAGASSSMLQSTAMDVATQRQLLETISDEATRLGRLLANILQMSKLDAGSASPNMQWQVLEEIIGSALHRTKSQLAQHEVVVRLPAEIPLLFVDELLIEQVFINLFENAARYTPPGTKICVSAAIEGKWLVISVSDNGPGFAPGLEEQIFDKFYRASDADSGRGSGLGLAICRAIVNAHGGRIASSNLGSGGAEFTVRLPLSSDAPRVSIE